MFLIIFLIFDFFLQILHFLRGPGGFDRPLNLLIFDFLKSVKSFDFFFSKNPFIPVLVFFLKMIKNIKNFFQKKQQINK